jgi:hypothetical protein
LSKSSSGSQYKTFALHLNIFKVRYVIRSSLSRTPFSLPLPAKPSVKSSQPESIRMSLLMDVLPSLAFLTRHKLLRNFTITVALLSILRRGGSWLMSPRKLRMHKSGKTFDISLLTSFELQRGTTRKKPLLTKLSKGVTTSPLRNANWS